jgi:LuxR family maltose regulon positive regulatory protein
LDEYDNDLALFLHYLTAAVQRAFPTASFGTVPLLQAPQLPPLPHLASVLINDLASLGQEYLLVLDDYHFIADDLIHKLLTRVIDYLPPSVHLVLSSRTEPPLPLPRLRSQQQMTEIRAADLCFSAVETQTFLAQALSTPPTQETVAALHARTEGWITGLQLATLALRGRADETDFVRSFAGSDRHVVDYLMEEVFARQPPAVQEFLMRTAILNRFCAPLYEALWGDAAASPNQVQPSDLRQPAAQAILEYLEQANLFIVFLDDRANWYRYHHLFRTMLHHHLQLRVSAAEIQLLHRRASAW